MTAKSKVKILSIKNMRGGMWVVKFDQNVVSMPPKDEVWVADGEQMLDELAVFNRAKELLNLED